MGARKPFRSVSVGLSLAAAVVLSVFGGGAAAGAAPLRATTAGPTCTLASPENITGVQVVNNQSVNGTWHYSTGVACTSAIADIALYEELDFNGTKADSKLKGFTGVSRTLDAITSNVPCSVCNGTWLFKWGQIMKAPSGFMFTSPATGCVLLQNGLYQLCVQTKTVII